jgi:hypothetical protein
MVRSSTPKAATSGSTHVGGDDRARDPTPRPSPARRGVREERNGRDAPARGSAPSLSAPGREGAGEWGQPAWTGEFPRKCGDPDERRDGTAVRQRRLLRLGTRIVSAPRRPQAGHGRSLGWEPSPGHPTGEL